MNSWKQWCRLCARENLQNLHNSGSTEGSVDTTKLAETIKKCFSINLNPDDDWSQMICIECHQFTEMIVKFSQRTSKVQAMFEDLLKSSEPFDEARIRSKYELDSNDVDFKVFGCSSDSETNVIEMAEEMIDVRQLSYNQEQEFNPLNIKAEESPNEDEDDSLNHDSGDNLSVSLKIESVSDEASGRNKSTPKPYACKDCKKEYQRYPNYRHHMRTEHGITLEPAEFLCTICSKKFTSAVQMRKHETTHLPLEQKLTRQCPHCDRRFCKNAAMTAHIRVVHMGAKPFVCESCGKICKTLLSLTEHRLTHTEEKPFKCGRCDKKFKTKLTLKIHEDTHNDNYICTICGLELNTRRTLNMHMVVHSDQRRHKCDYCGNEYKRAKALKNHLILHTGQKPYTCNFCGKSFANGSNCRSHKKKSHPVELAAWEAAGTKTFTVNIPNLKELKVATALITTNAEKNLDMDVNI